MADNCIIENGYALGCQGTGGVKRVYLGNYDPEIGWVVDANGVISAAPTTPSAEVYRFDQFAETAEFVQNGIYGDNRTKGIESKLTIKLDHFDAQLTNQYRALTKAYLFAIVESEEGDFVLLGKDSPGAATEDNSGFGVEYTDMNGVEITFTWRSKDGAFPIDGVALLTDLGGTGIDVNPSAPAPTP